MHFLTSSKCSRFNSSRTGLPGLWESERNTVLKLFTAAVLCLPCFLHYSLANSFPLLYLSPLCLRVFGFLLVVPHSACFPQSGAMCFPISAKGYGSASCRLCVPEKGALSVGGNSCFDVIVQNCSSWCNIRVKM